MYEYSEVNDVPRFQQPQAAQYALASEDHDPDLSGSERPGCLAATQEWDKMGRFGAGTENLGPTGPAALEIQVQNPVSDTPAWEEMGKNGSNREKSCPAFPTSSRLHASPSEPDAAGGDSVDANPEFLRGLLEFLGSGEPEPSGELKKASPLTPRQLSALPYLAAFPNATQAARAAGIGKSTLYRWLEDDDFREELTRFRTEAAEFANQELKGLQLRAVDVLREAMNHSDIGVRLRAARYSMSFSAQVGLAEKLRQQIEHLETAFEHWKPKRPF